MPGVNLVFLFIFKSYEKNYSAARYRSRLRTVYKTKGKNTVHHDYRKFFG